MKGITKDHETITKDYEILFCSMKDKCKKKNFALHLRPYVPIPQYWSGVSCICDIIAEFKLSCKIFHIYDTFHKKSPAFTYTLIISRYDNFLYVHAAYIHS